MLHPLDTDLNYDIHYLIKPHLTAHQLIVFNQLEGYYHARLNVIFKLDLPKWAEDAIDVIEERNNIRFDHAIERLENLPNKCGALQE